MFVNILRIPGLKKIIKSNFVNLAIKMSFEEKYANVCRTCLVENSTMKSVFSIEEFMEQSIPLCDILMSFTSVQVSF